MSIFRVPFFSKPDSVRQAIASPLLRVHTDEGFRLFFPLGALYAAIWPFQWVLIFSLDLPLARATPPSLWHGHEMLFGAFGAALIGFITTAVPEWTDTPRPQGRPLLFLAALWGVGRLVGFAGADIVGPLGAICDIAWLVVLVIYLARVSLTKQTDRLLAFIGWLLCLIACELGIRLAFFINDFDLASQMLRVSVLAFLGLLGLALARITVPVTNLVLDPSEATSPFRPHPGRLHLASGLAAIAIMVDLAEFSEATRGYVLIGAGAAFMDRVGEAFIGWKGFRAEIAVMAGASMLAGCGLLLSGGALLGAPFPMIAGLHVATMGGLGLGVFAVFNIAGLLHTRQPLKFNLLSKLAMLSLIAATALRVLPDLGLIPHPFGTAYLFPALLWAAAFLLWLKAYLPALGDARTTSAVPETPSCSA